MLDGPLWLDFIHPPNHLIDRAEAQPGHMLPHVLGNEVHEIDYMRRITRKPLAQFRVLGRHTHWAGIQMTHPHHDTANGHQRCRGKAKLLCSKERCHNHIASGFELAIRLHRNAAAQVVQHQRLMCLRQAQLPG